MMEVVNIHINNCVVHPVPKWSDDVKLQFDSLGIQLKCALTTRYYLKKTPQHPEIIVNEGDDSEHENNHKFKCDMKNQCLAAIDANRALIDSIYLRMHKLTLHYKDLNIIITLSNADKEVKFTLDEVVEYPKTKDGKLKKRGKPVINWKGDFFN
jgi:hypothetical protein